MGELGRARGPSTRPTSLTSVLCFCSSSKILKPQMNASVFGSLQNVKDNKSKPVRDEYEYVSDEGELKIDEFPIRRKKNSARRDQTCEYPEPFPRSPHQSGRPERFLLSLIILMLICLETRSLAVYHPFMSFFFFIFSFLGRQRTNSADKESKVPAFGEQGGCLSVSQSTRSRYS